MISFRSLSVLTTILFLSPTGTVVANFSNQSSATVVADNSKPANRQIPIRGFLQELNLSPAQKQKIEQIRRQYQGQINLRKKNLRSARQKLVEMMTGTDPAEAIRSQYQQVLTLRQELEELRFESILDTREILTPEQRQKFADIMQSRRQRFQEEQK